MPRPCKRAKKRYRRLAEYSPEAILVHINGIVAYVNPAAVKLHGASGPEDIAGKRFTQFLHPGDLEKVLARNHRMEKTFQVPLTELRAIGLDEKIRATESNAAMITYNCQTAIQAVIRDVTDRKALEQQLQQAQKVETLGTLAGSMAHNFNNMLVPTMRSAEKAQDSLPQDHPAIDQLRWRTRVMKQPLPSLSP